ncbi:hypothetical protein SLA2020_322610 [Shorea laevis]
MADNSSFEIDYFSSQNRRPHHCRHNTPSTSRYVSRSHTPRMSHRLHYDSPEAPFAADDDTSWQGEVSWQFEPLGWGDSRSLSAVLSPWAASATANTPTASREFRRLANNYYLSRTSGSFGNYGNSYYKYSSALPSGRLELQSYVARDDESVMYPNLGDYGNSQHGFQDWILLGKQIGNVMSSPLSNEDEISRVDYDTTKDVERQIHLQENDPGQYKFHDSSWFSSIDDDGCGDDSHVQSHGISHGRHHQARHKVGWLHHHESHQRHHGDGSLNGDDGDDGFDGIDCASKFNEEEEEEDEGEASPRLVGLFSLFKYSTEWDMVLVFLGCLRAFVNGGSLPWYSFPFGNFVNKIAKETKSQMMREVDKICLAMTGLAAIVVVGASLEITCWRLVGD